MVLHSFYLTSIVFIMTTMLCIQRTSLAFSFAARKSAQLTPTIKRRYMKSTITMMPEGPEVRTLVDQLQPAVGMRLIDFRFVSGRYVRHGRPTGFEEFAKTMTPVVADGTNGGGDATSATLITTEETDGGDNNSQFDIITSLKCKGKFIYLTLDHGNNAPRLSNTTSARDYQRSIWITLGMTGQFVNEARINTDAPTSNEKSKPRWYMELMDTATNKTRRIYYRDARNFGTLKFVLSAKDLDDKLDTLGADLLDENTTEDLFLELMEKSVQSRNICKFLMDQGKLAGVG